MCPILCLYEFCAIQPEFIVKPLFVILRNFAVKNMTMKIILLMALLLTMFLGMHAQTGMRMLITYFSWSGSTKNLAEEIQRQPDADIYRIEPLVPYTDDYQELAYQISNKEKEENARPALKDTLSTLNDIANATSDSEHLDGLGTRGSQSSYAQEVSSWFDRIGINNIVSGIEGVSAGQQPTTNNAAYIICGMKIGNIETAPKGIYSVNGMVSDGQGIVIHNRKKYINSKK